MEYAAVDVGNRDKEEIWTQTASQQTGTHGNRRLGAKLTEYSPAERDPEGDGKEDRFREEHADRAAEGGLEHFGERGALKLVLALVSTVARRLAQFGSLAGEEDGGARFVQDERHEDGERAAHGEKSPADIAEASVFGEVSKRDGTESGRCVFAESKPLFTEDSGEARGRTAKGGE